MRRIIQITACTTPDDEVFTLFALASDESIWVGRPDGQWTRVTAHGLPQEEAAETAAPSEPVRMERLKMLPGGKYQTADGVVHAAAEKLELNTEGAVTGRWKSGHEEHSHEALPAPDMDQNAKRLVGPCKACFVCGYSGQMITGYPKGYQGFNTGMWRVECSCGGAGGYKFTQDDAMASWNKVLRVADMKAADQAAHDAQEVLARRIQELEAGRSGAP